MGQQHQTHGAAHGTEHRSPGINKTHLTHRSCARNGFEGGWALRIAEAPCPLGNGSGTHQNHFIAPGQAGPRARAQLAITDKSSPAPSAVSRAPSNFDDPPSGVPQALSAQGLAGPIGPGVSSGSLCRSLSGAGTSTSLLSSSSSSSSLSRKAPGRWRRASAVRASRSSSMAACRAACSRRDVDLEFPDPLDL